METTNTPDSARAALKDALGMYGEITINLEMWQDRKVAARQAIERAQADLARALQDEQSSAPRAALAAVPDSASP